MLGRGGPHSRGPVPSMRSVPEPAELRVGTRQELYMVDTSRAFHPEGGRALIETTRSQRAGPWLGEQAGPLT